MLSLPTKLGLSKLQTKLSLSKLKNYIDQKNILVNKHPLPPNGEIKVAATAVPFLSFQSPEEFIDYIESFIKEASDKGCLIISFPQLTGLLPLGCIGAFDEILNIIFSSGKTENVSRHDIINLSEVFDIIGESLFEFYYNLFSLLAARYKIYIHAGTTVVMSRTGLSNRSFFFDDMGRCVCEQGKINPGRTEQSFNLLQSDSLDVFELPFGKIATIIGSDQYYFECFKTGRSLGAKIVFVPCGPNFNVNDFKARRGAGTFGSLCELSCVKSCLVGQAGGMTFSDRSGIYLSDGTSFLSKTFTEKEIIIGTIPPQRLTPAVPEIYMGDKNLALYEKYLSRFKDKSEEKI